MQQQTRDIVRVAHRPLTAEQLALCTLHLRAFCLGPDLSAACFDDLVSVGAADLVDPRFGAKKLEAMLVAHNDHVRIVLTSRSRQKKKALTALRDGYLAWLNNVAKAELCLSGSPFGEVPGVEVYDLQSHCVKVSASGGTDVRIEIAHGTRDYLAEWLDELAGRDAGRLLDALEQMAAAPFYQRSHFTLDAQDLMRDMLEG